MHRGHGLGAAALRDHLAGATFTTPALGGNAQLKLDVVKAHASTRVARNVTVGDAAANTDDHGDRQGSERLML